MKNKYQEAYVAIIESLNMDLYPGETPMENIDVAYVELMKESVDKETPMKPTMVMLFGDLVPTCPKNGCGVGLNHIESIWHKSSYCGNCGQKIDWSEDEEN